MAVRLYEWSDEAVTAFRQFASYIRRPGDLPAAIEELSKQPNLRLVAEFETNVDGKFRTPNLAQGRYILHAQWHAARSDMYWLFILEVDCTDDRELSLHNKNATAILNDD